MAERVLSGGDKFEKALQKISNGMRGELSVGFMEDSTYPDGTPVAAVAFYNEFGAKVEVEEHETTIYRSIRADGTFNRKGKFVKKRNSNFATAHHVGAHEIVIPARPFFRGMIEKESPTWPKKVAEGAKTTNYDGKKVLKTMGQEIAGKLQQSINEFSGTPLSAATVKKKGFDKQLVDTEKMLESVTFKVDA